MNSLFQNEQNNKVDQVIQLPELQPEPTTSTTVKGSSVVEYCLIPQKKLDAYTDFNVILKQLSSRIY